VGTRAGRGIAEMTEIHARDGNRNILSVLCRLLWSSHREAVFPIVYVPENITVRRLKCLVCSISV
jgi:hypothetical protein